MVAKREVLKNILVLCKQQEEEMFSWPFARKMVISHRNAQSAPKQIRDQLTDCRIGERVARVAAVMQTLRQTRQESHFRERAIYGVQGRSAQLLSVERAFETPLPRVSLYQAVRDCACGFPFITECLIDLVSKRVRGPLLCDTWGYPGGISQRPPVWDCKEGVINTEP